MEIRELIKKHEGLRLEPYRCTAGKLTVGYGHNLDAHGEAPRTITIEEAESYLDADIKRAQSDCAYFIPGWDDLDKSRKAALIDMAFNLGISGLMKFKQTLQYLAQRKYEHAAKEMLKSIWAIQVGNRAVELSEIIKTGEL